MSGEKKPTIPEVLPVAIAYYRKPGNGAGGTLHIVLDDNNVSDGDVSYCLQLAEQVGDTDGVALAQMLLRMSRTQRLKLSMLASRGAR